jgi:hypothetical protein
LRIGGERNPVGERVSHVVGKALVYGLRLVGSLMQRSYVSMTVAYEILKTTFDSRVSSASNRP